MKRTALILAALLCMASRHPDRMIRSDILLNCSFNRGDGSTRSMVARTPTLTNGAVVTAGNRHLTLDGVNYYLSFPDSSDLSFGSAGTDSPFTVMAWFKQSANPGDFSKAIACKGTTANYEWDFVCNGGAGIGPRLVLYNAAASASISRYSSTKITDTTTYHHVAGTYSGSKAASGIKIYTDGVQSDTTTLTSGSYAGMTNGTGPLTIGMEHPSSINFAGDIDDVRIYNRELTAAEVAAIYSSGRE